MNFGMTVLNKNMETDSLLPHIKTEDFFIDIFGHVEKRFDMSMMKTIKDCFQ